MKLGCPPSEAAREEPVRRRQVACGQSRGFHGQRELDRLGAAHLRMPSSSDWREGPKIKPETKRPTQATHKHRFRFTGEKGGVSQCPSKRKATTDVEMGIRANRLRGCGGECKSHGNPPTLWHVAIATYSGNVPSNEVAAFLINSAEWGVRSVELFGQTTYFSRSFVDLKDAQEMLSSVQSEGFSQARIEALN